MSFQISGVIFFALFILAVSRAAEREGLSVDEIDAEANKEFMGSTKGCLDGFLLIIFFILTTMARQ